MSRDNWDIPEVFRRAMEEAGWESGNKREGGSEGGDGGDRPPIPRRPQQPRGSNRSRWIIGILFLLFISINWIVGVYTDWLWFSEIDYQNIWLTRWSYQLISFATFFVIAFLILWGNWHIARRRAIKATPPFYPKFLQINGVQWILAAVALVLAFGFASSIAVRWNEFLLFINRVPFGTADPIFGRDISFYFFELPVYEALQQWIVSLLLLTLIGTLAIYAINNVVDIQRGQWRPQESPILRQHVALLAALLLLLWASGYLFQVFNLNYSGRGVVFGASYTDINASLYALYAQMALMVVAALVMLLNVFRLNIRPLLIAAGLWLAATLLIGGIYPALLQRYEVEPNELVRETPYIQDNIDFTRLAFNLDKIEIRSFDEIGPLDQTDIDANNDVLTNIRLWDYRPLQATYTQLQALRPYYVFGEVDIDRYNIDGEIRQVMLATRELDKTQLPSLSWVNEKLEFTHGYGIVMNPVDRFTSDGQPEFFIKNLPTHGKLREPFFRFTQILRAFHFSNPQNKFWDAGWSVESDLRQFMFNAPSVFNFFAPGYRPPGAAGDAGLAAPEFQLLNSYTAISTINFWYSRLEWGYVIDLPEPDQLIKGQTYSLDQPQPDLSYELTLANDVPALLDHLDLLLTSGTMSAEMRAIIETAVSGYAADSASDIEIVNFAIFLFMSCPEYAVQV